MNSVIYAVSGHLAKQLCCCGREHELEPASGTKTVPMSHRAKPVILAVAAVQDRGAASNRLRPVTRCQAKLLT